MTSLQCMIYIYSFRKKCDVVNTLSTNIITTNDLFKHYNCFCLGFFNLVLIISCFFCEVKTDCKEVTAQCKILCWKHTLIKFYFIKLITARIYLFWNHIILYFFNVQKWLKLNIYKYIKLRIYFLIDFAIGTNIQYWFSIY